MPNYLETTFNPESGKNESVLINFDPDAATYDFASFAFEGDPDDIGYRMAKLTSNLAIYEQYNIYLLVFASSMLFSLLLKFVFNVFATVKLPIDKWVIVDSFCGALKIISVLVM